MFRVLAGGRVPRIFAAEVGLDGSEPPFPPSWSGPTDDDTWNRRVPEEDPRAFAMLQDLLDVSYKRVPADMPAALRSPETQNLVLNQPMSH